MSTREVCASGFGGDGNERERSSVGVERVWGRSSRRRLGASARASGRDAASFEPERGVGRSRELAPIWQRDGRVRRSSVVAASVGRAQRSANDTHLLCFRSGRIKRVGNRGGHGPWSNACRKRSSECVRWADCGSSSLNSVDTGGRFGEEKFFARDEPTTSHDASSETTRRIPRFRQPRPHTSDAQSPRFAFRAESTATPSACARGEPPLGPASRPPWRRWSPSRPRRRRFEEQARSRDPRVGARARRRARRLASRRACRANSARLPLLRARASACAERRPAR